MSNKMKTNRSARKRFKLTKTGKVRRYKAFKSHRKQTRNQKRIRATRRHAICEPGDARVAKAMITGS